MKYPSHPSAAASPPQRPSIFFRDLQIRRADGPAPLTSCDRQFVEMLNGYRHSGGLARKEELLEMLQLRPGSAVATLGRWIAEREIICFEWQTQLWVPLFQFERPSMNPASCLPALFAELLGVFDAWELALWFAQPNGLLSGRCPADALPFHAAAVLAAARTDRFIADG